ncbi:MAG: PadR family transcriptional regulator [Gemmatimonadetes bacterium]|nr:PadR family transcriptional regulator [Gemmatimonadota bacterium]
MDPKERSLIPGTVDLLVLRALTTGPLHGFGVSRVLLGRSDGMLEVKDAALYQALHRLEEQRMVTSSWGLSENNRRAKFYAITARGRRHLEREAGVFRAQAGAVLRVLGDEA